MNRRVNLFRGALVGAQEIRLSRRDSIEKLVGPSGQFQDVSATVRMLLWAGPGTLVASHKRRSLSPMPRLDFAARLMPAIVTRRNASSTILLTVRS
jgi:hypothetical protein